MLYLLSNIRASCSLLIVVILLHVCDILRCPMKDFAINTEVGQRVHPREFLVLWSRPLMIWGAGGKIWNEFIFLSRRPLLIFFPQRGISKFPFSRRKAFELFFLNFLCPCPPRSLMAVPYFFCIYSPFLLSVFQSLKGSTNTTITDASLWNEWDIERQNKKQCQSEACKAGKCNILYEELALALCII